jgi:transcriptional regulator with XRE-family HTH domain
MKDYGGVVRACRKYRHITQTTLSKLTGISQETISNYESGKKIMRMDVFEKLMDAMDFEIGIKEK